MSASKSLKSILFQHLWNLRWPLIVVVLVLTFTAGFVIHTFAQGSTASYFSACLNTVRGTLSNVAVGTVPLKPCTSSQTPITWSNGDILGVTAGTGLTGGGIADEVMLTADTNYLQQRVSTPCPEGSSIRIINSDGTVICETDDDTTYTAGYGLLLVGNEFQVNTVDIQDRIDDTCAAGSSIRVINSNGSVVCEPDTDTTYTAGSGLSLIGNQFSLTDGAVTTEKLADNSVTSTKLADDSVNDRHLNLNTSEIYLGPNTEITSSASPGQTFLSFSDLAPGTYIIYGLAQGYVDQAADTNGGIIFVINDGTNVLRPGPQFYFTEATGWQELQAAGFMFVITLNETTTLNLAAYKGPGSLTVANVGGGTHFGYIKIGS